MRNLLFAFFGLFFVGFAGCVWSPDSTTTGYPQNSYPYISYEIHRISQRSVTGVESLSTVVYPSPNEYGWDSIRYLIVNGDTAYRHPNIAAAPSYDSSVPYRLDGSANFVEIVFPSLTLGDTSYTVTSDLTDKITSPAYGDTIQRSTDLSVNYQISPSYSGEVIVSDSINFYSQYAAEYDNMVDFPLNQIETLRPPTLWIDLSTESNVESNSYYNYISQRSILLDRIVAYPLH